MSTWRAFVAWRRQRLPLLPFVGVAFVVATAAGPPTLSSTLTALVWIAALRLWDDVASRDADARRHPGRVVVRGPRAPFARAAAVAIAIAIVVAAAASALVGFLLIVLGLAALMVRPPPPTIQKLLVLLKYPAMAALLAQTPPSPLHLLLLWGCFVVDEWLTGEAPLPRRALPFAVTLLLLCLS